WDRDILLDLGNPIDELVAGRVDGIADRIDDERAMTRADPGDAAAGQEWLAPGHAAPKIDAAKAERTLVRIELRTHGRVDAIACDQDIALLCPQCAAIGPDKACRDAAVVLLHADAAMAGYEILRAEPLAHGVKQHLVQVAAMDRKVRPLMAGREAP